MLNELAQKIYEANKEKGFWDKEMSMDDLFMLVATEMEKTLESYRNGGIEDEIADAIIRLLDMSAGLGIDIDKHIEAKLQYNLSRPQLHGKNY